MKKKTGLNKVIVIPDSFKGTMSSVEICEIISCSILEKYPACQVISIPVADGGEGTVECLSRIADVKKEIVEVTGPAFNKVTAEYAVSGDTAIMELAEAAGLTLADEGARNPMKTTTFGVGEMIRDAVFKGYRNIILGIGGSATNDCGAGAAAALGTVFTDHEGNSLIPTGENLIKVRKIDNSKTEELLRDCSIRIICDVDNPLYGEKGAAHVFAPQKGADAEMVELLNKGLEAFAKTMESQLGIDMADVPGAGAAGGMGAGSVAFLGGVLNRGIDVILDMVGFEEKLEHCDLVITGEGSLDSQSLRGKVISGVADRARKQNVSVIAVVGQVDASMEEIEGMGVNAVFTTNQKAQPLSESAPYCKGNLKMTIDNIMNIFRITDSEK